MSSAALPVLAITGMTSEARIATSSSTGIVALAGGGDPARLALLLQGALARGAKAVISFGIAGGLAPTIRPGTAIVGRSVDDGETCLSANTEWVERLLEALPNAILGDLAGTDHMVVGKDAKAALYRATGALAVDMESHVAARLAAQYGVPFAALRVVADPAERTLPYAATVGMRADGTMDVGAVMRALSCRPRELPALIRTALDAQAAFSILTKSRARLCSLLGFGDQGLVTAPDGFAMARALVDIEAGIGTLGAQVEAQTETV